MRTHQDGLRQWLGDLADEMAGDSSGDWGEKHDPAGVGWERCCKNYAAIIRQKLAEQEEAATRPKASEGGGAR